MWNIHSAKAAMPRVSCPCFNIGWTVASVQQRNSCNVNASVQQICRRLVNSAIKGQKWRWGTCFKYWSLKKWTVGLLLLSEFGARVLFWIVWFGIFVCLGLFWVKIWVLLWYFFQLLCTTNMKDSREAIASKINYFSVAMQLTLLYNFKMLVTGPHWTTLDSSWFFCL